MGHTDTWNLPSCIAVKTPVELISSIVVIAAPSFGLVEKDSPVGVSDSTSALVGTSLDSPSDS